MSSTGIFWIREDFRIENNPALSYATQNHDSVLALYIYNKNDFDGKREAQKWWLSKSLEIFKSELSKFKINLQILHRLSLAIKTSHQPKVNLRHGRYLSTVSVTSSATNSYLARDSATRIDHRKN